MTTKKAVILTIIIPVVGIALGLGLMFMLVDITASGAEQKAAALGQIVAIVTLIPIFVVWILWGVNAQKAKENSAAKPKRKR